MGKKQKAKLEGPDFLRLRTLLTIILVTGSSEITIMNPERKLSSLQVLPIEGDAASWPQLIGQVLYAIFGGNKPAIQFLQIEEIHNQMPDDLLETWAVTLWCLQAALQVAVSPKERDRLNNSLKPLAERVFRFLQLTQSELESDEIKQVFNRLNERFSERLGTAKIRDPILHSI